MPVMRVEAGRAISVMARSGWGEGSATGVISVVGVGVNVGEGLGRILVGLAVMPGGEACCGAQAASINETNTRNVGSM